MAFLHLEFNSAALQMVTGVDIILPDTGALSAVPTVYLFHGLSDNCSCWCRYTSCERYAKEYGVAVIMPEVQRSFYIDAVYGLRYFTYVSQELPRAMHRMFGLSMERQRSFVMGLSMGGYGALKCALTHPDHYAGCASFSGVTDLAAFLRLTEFNGLTGEYTALLGPERALTPENDLRALLDAAQDLPPIYLSCGEQDPLRGMNRKFAALLEKKGCAFRFDRRPGNHTWEFWDQSLQDAFSFFFGKK